MVEYFRASARDDEAATPGGEVVRYILVPLTITLLLGGGVYWLRQMSAGSTASDSGGSIQVRLLNLPDATPIAPLNKRDVAVDVTAPSEEHDRAASFVNPIVSASLEPVQTSTELDTAKALPARLPPAPTAATNPAVIKFERALLHHIARFQTYPAAARRDHTEGTVLIRFSIRRDGTIATMQVKTSSGTSLLDQAALETLRRAQPLPHIPSELPDELSILLPIAFDLS
jgi:periplasmic protein TonB